MKIGIITVHLCDNYGAVLQAYALKRTVECLVPKAIVELIDYRPLRWQDAEKINFSRNIKDNIIQLERMLFYKCEKRRWEGYKNFIAQNDDPTEICTTSKELELIASGYDYVIVGSDQVWNIDMTYRDVNYYLGFNCGRAVKLSYASSMGGRKFEKDDQLFIAYLKKFKSLSCRESDGAQYISDITGKGCKHVVDPTLLLTQEDYQRLINPDEVRRRLNVMTSGEYILVYALRFDSMISKQAEVWSKKYGLKVIVIFPNMRFVKYAFQTVFDANVEEFLYLFSKAKFVITDSFHGTCFSLINRKQFLVLKHNEQGNSRLTSMLDKFGLLEHLRIECKCATENMPPEIDYSELSKRINMEKTESIKYLTLAMARE